MYSGHQPAVACGTFALPLPVEGCWEWPPKKRRRVHYTTAIVPISLCACSVTPVISRELWAEKRLRKRMPFPSPTKKTCILLRCPKFIPPPQMFPHSEVYSTIESCVAHGNETSLFPGPGRPLLASLAGIRVNCQVWLFNLQKYATTISKFPNIESYLMVS